MTVGFYNQLPHHKESPQTSLSGKVLEDERLRHVLIIFIYHLHRNLYSFIAFGNSYNSHIFVHFSVGQGGAGVGRGIKPKCLARLEARPCRYILYHIILYIYIYVCILHHCHAYRAGFFLSTSSTHMCVSPADSGDRSFHVSHMLTQVSGVLSPRSVGSLAGTFTTA